jgi:hypothetical protein
MELRCDTRRHLQLARVADRLQMCEGALRGDFVVQRFGRRVFRIAMAIRLSRVFLLDAAGVGQHQPAEVLRARRTERAPSESPGNQPWQVAHMVQMGVGQYDGRNRLRWDWKFLPVAQPERLQSLEQPAVDQHAHALVLEEVFRPGDGACRTEKCQTRHATVVSLRGWP